MYESDKISGGEGSNSLDSSPLETALIQRNRLRVVLGPSENLKSNNKLYERNLKMARPSCANGITYVSRFSYTRIVLFKYSGKR